MFWGMEIREFEELRRAQVGAFSRAQAHAHGMTDKVLLRRVRTSQLQRVHAGVYVDFTGPLPWETRAWAAWLSCRAGAALTGGTAIRAHGVTMDHPDDTIHVALPHSRRIDPKAGVVVTRHRDLPAFLHPRGEDPPPEGAVDSRFTVIGWGFLDCKSQKFRLRASHVRSQH
jgi:hypothetical protein